MLAISDKVRFPLDAVTQPFALLAMRGAGKSNAAVVMAEQMFLNDLPFVVIDPKGDWWGIRSDRTGSKPGLPIPVFGGLHGDLPLEPTAGALIADTIVELNLTCVLDVSEFNSKGEQIKFLTDFAERLFRLQGKTPEPRHLFLEEADEFIPQRVTANIARCVGAWTKIVKQGRSRGLGITIISQRSAVVSKDALTQVETLIALRTTSPQDRKAILGWVDYHSVSKELVDSLPGLKAGEAWIISPHWLGAIERAQFRQRTTFDSGATPKHGAKRAVSSIADVDMGALEKAMAATIERAAAEDPKRLQADLRQARRERDALQQMLDERDEVCDVPAPEIIEKPVPYYPPIIEDAVIRMSSVGDDLTRVAKDLITMAVELAAQLEKAPPPFQTAPPAVPQRPIIAGGGRLEAAKHINEPKGPPMVTQNVGSNYRYEGAALGKAEKAVMGVLFQYPDGRTKRQVGMLTGYSSKGGGFNNALSSLRSKGLLNKGEPMILTSEGQIMAAGMAFEPLPAPGRPLLEHWMGQVKGKAERLVIDALYRAHVHEHNATVTKEWLAMATGYEATGGGFNNALSRLRTLELISGSGDAIALCPDLLP